MPEIGYTHSMFSGNFRKYAQKVDKDTANGGNNNGMIDGKEVEAFKALVKKETGYDFSFANIHQSVAKQVLVKDKNGWKYNSAIQLAEAYREFGASSQAIIGLNGGDPFATNKTSSVIVPHSAYLKADEAEVARQEKEAYTKMAEKNKVTEQQNNKKHCPSFWDNPIAWLKHRWLCH